MGQPPAEAQAEALLSYLRRYLHRTATANARLIEIEQGQVTFEYSDNRDRDETKAGQTQDDESQRDRVHPSFPAPHLAQVDIEGS